MFVDPKKVCFETKQDVIDYISAGLLPPSKRNCNMVLDKVINPSEDPEGVVIAPSVIPDEDREIMAKVLKRVHHNRRVNCMKIGAVLGAFLLHVLYSKK